MGIEKDALTGFVPLFQMAINAAIAHHIIAKQAHGSAGAIFFTAHRALIVCLEELLNLQSVLESGRLELVDQLRLRLWLGARLQVHWLAYQHGKLLFQDPQLGIAESGLQVRPQRVNCLLFNVGLQHQGLDDVKHY